LIVQVPLAVRLLPAVIVKVRPADSVIFPTDTAVEIVGSFVTPAPGMLTSFIAAGVAPVVQFVAVAQAALEVPFQVAVLLTFWPPASAPLIAVKLVSPL